MTAERRTLAARSGRGAGPRAIVPPPRRLGVLSTGVFLSRRRPSAILRGAVAEKRLRTGTTMCWTDTRPRCSLRSRAPRSGFALLLLLAAAAGAEVARGGIEPAPSAAQDEARLRALLVKERSQTDLSQRKDTLVEARDLLDKADLDSIDPTLVQATVADLHQVYLKLSGYGSTDQECDFLDAAVELLADYLLVWYREPSDQGSAAGRQVGRLLQHFGDTAERRDCLCKDQPQKNVGQALGVYEQLDTSLFDRRTVYSWRKKLERCPSSYGELITSHRCPSWPPDARPWIADYEERFRETGDWCRSHWQAFLSTFPDGAPGLPRSQVELLLEGLKRAADDG